MRLIVLAAVLFVGAGAFGVVRQNSDGALCSPTKQHHVTLLHASARGPGNIQRPQNEFSRTYRTESVLGSKQRDYQASIEATEEEREKLAQRFDLANIGCLQADLVMRREPGIKGTANRGE